MSLWFGALWFGDPAEPGPDSGAGLVGVARGVPGVPWSSARRGQRREEKERWEKPMVRVTCLSPASSEVFSVQGGGGFRSGVALAPAGFSPGRAGSCRRRGSGSERTAAVSLFLHYINV